MTVTLAYTYIVTWEHVYILKVNFSKKKIEKSINAYIQYVINIHTHFASIPYLFLPYSFLLHVLFLYFPTK